MKASALVIVQSPLRTTSPRTTKSHADINPNVEVSAIVTVPSQSPHTSPQKTKYLGDVKAISLVLQNHFSSLDGLETTDVGGDSHIGASTIPPTIVGINSDHLENQVVSKFWADSNEMEEDGSDNGEETVRTKRKSGRPPKETGKSRKTAKAILSTTSQ